MPRVLQPVNGHSFHAVYDGLTQTQDGAQQLPDHLLIGRMRNSSGVVVPAAVLLDVDTKEYGVPRITTAEFLDEYMGPGNATRLVKVSRALLRSSGVVVEQGQTGLYGGMQLTPDLADIVLRWNSLLTPISNRGQRQEIFSSIADLVSQLQLGRQPA